MSVAIVLDVEDVNSALMMEAQQGWERWTTQEPDLLVVDDLLSLREWTRTADFEPRDAILRSLARLGSSTGADDPAATTALTWLLVPGAAAVAHRLTDLCNNVDELVASHLWTAAKTFEWERRRSVAAAILRDTRRGVLAELGVGEWARRQDRTWSQTTCIESTSAAWQWHAVDETADDPTTELRDLLGEASAAGVITRQERDFLVDLAIIADQARTVAGRGRAGLTGSPAADVVAQRLGITARSVRRRAANLVDKLAYFSSHRDKEVPVASHPAEMAMSA